MERMYGFNACAVINSKETEEREPWEVTVQAEVNADAQLYYLASCLVVAISKLVGADVERVGNAVTSGAVILDKVAPINWKLVQKKKGVDA